MQEERQLLNQIFRTYAKERAVGAIHELPLRQNEAFRAFLRKSYLFFIL
jgi:hypothetical protein